MEEEGDVFGFAERNLEPAPPTQPPPSTSAPECEGGEDCERCPICLDSFECIRERAVVEGCLHSFCLACIREWALVSPSCPLCKARIGKSLLVALDPSNLRFCRLELQPSSSHQLKQAYSRGRSQLSNTVSRHQSVRSRIASTPSAAPLDPATAALLASASTRSHVYQHSLFSKHIASNMHTRAKPLPVIMALFRNPTSPDSVSLRSKVAHWIRRDLRVLLMLHDVEIVLEYVLAVLNKYDLQTDAAIALLRPYLRAHTEHFVHELVGFLRSGLTVDAYDNVVQYPEPVDDALADRIRRHVSSLSRMEHSLEPNGLSLSLSRMEHSLEPNGLSLSLSGLRNGDGRKRGTSGHSDRNNSSSGSPDTHGKRAHREHFRSNSCDSSSSSSSIEGRKNTTKDRNSSGSSSGGRRRSTRSSGSNKNGSSSSGDSEGSLPIRKGPPTDSQQGRDSLTFNPLESSHLAENSNAGLSIVGRANAASTEINAVGRLPAKVTLSIVGRAVRSV